MAHFRIVAIVLFGVWIISTGALADGFGKSPLIPKGTVITIGVEESNSEWPPFEYYERVNGEKTDKLTGFTVEIITAIFEEQGLGLRIVKHPWKRLLKQLEEGNPVELIFPTSLNPERVENYLVSDQVYSITPTYFYLKDKFPKGLNLGMSNELLHFKPICGKLGYNYVNFGISNDQVIRSSYNYDHLMDLLKHRRCEIILARYEILAAYAEIGNPYISEEVGFEPVPGVEQESFHYLISKRYQYGEKLLTIINRGLKNLKEQGQYQKLFEQYVQVIPRRAKVTR